MNVDSPSEELAKHYLVARDKLEEMDKLLASVYNSNDLIALFTRYYVGSVTLADEMRLTPQFVQPDDMQKIVMLRSLLEERLNAIDDYMVGHYQKDVLDAQEKMHFLTWTVFGMILLLTATLTIISYLIIRGLTQRINTLVAFAKEVERGNYKISLSMPWHDEFATVANALDKMVKSINDKNATLNRLANFDSLTEIHNRNSLLERLASEVRSVRRHRYPMSFCLCDIDHFKQVNDQHGHLLGDYVLQEFSRVLREELRMEDVVGRYGGDEFCVIFTHTDVDKAQRALERVLRRFVALEFIDANKNTFLVTASFGVCQYHPDMEVADLMRMADEALYTAKRSGRGQIAVAGN